MFALRTPTELKAKKKAPFSQTQIAKEEESKGTVQNFFESLKVQCAVINAVLARTAKTKDESTSAPLLNDAVM